MPDSRSSFSRRNFLHAGSLLLGATAFPSHRVAADPAAGKKLFTAMGISGSLEQAAALKSDGAEFLTESVSNFLVPDKSDEEFGKNLAKLATSPLPVLACNSFIRPANLRCTGPEANHDLICQWAETTFRRLKQAGGKFIVFGSSSSRQLPDGWPRKKADEQFVALLKLLGPQAEAHGVTVTVEQLRSQECNYINHIGEAAALIRAADHPHIRLLADFYHMASMGDTPADLKAAMDVVAHIEIAEKNARTVPGVEGDDFRPFFRVLRECGYQGAISIEGKSTAGQISIAFAEIAKQAAEV
ncbi:MAG: sugar phosphate isomerase/epimerase family protein [Luteolibacter sp.]